VNKFTDPGDDSDASKSLELDKGPSKIGFRTWRARQFSHPTFPKALRWALSELAETSRQEPVEGSVV
jgi:hypothetical protein